jgi:hypothetical protein
MGVHVDTEIQKGRFEMKTKCRFGMNFFPKKWKKKFPKMILIQILGVFVEGDYPRDDLGLSGLHEEDKDRAALGSHITAGAAPVNGVF